jgi:drug/metabolite transporter (DMT)-like permease
LAYASVASSVVLASSSPLFVAVIAVLILNEQVSRAVVIGLGLTLAETLVVSFSGACAYGCPAWSAFVHGPAVTGDLLALLGAAAMAVYLSAGRAVRGSMSLTFTYA